MTSINSRPATAFNHLASTRKLRCWLSGNAILENDRRLAASGQSSGRRLVLRRSNPARFVTADRGGVFWFRQGGSSVSQAHRERRGAWWASRREAHCSSRPTTRLCPRDQVLVQVVIVAKPGWPACSHHWAANLAFQRSKHMLAAGMSHGDRVVRAAIQAPREAGRPGWRTKSGSILMSTSLPRLPKA
jgi:hypothetical protein